MTTSRSYAVLSLLALVVAAAALYQTTPAERPLADSMPPGALLVLEARDFSAVLADWNQSKEKELWLAGDNYKVFSRSRLFLRLKEAVGEFGSAAGLAPDMALVQSVAGSESAVAIYDIGKLEFLYITRMPAARAFESVLWRKRADFEPRKVADFEYFVRADPESRRVVAFAAADDHLLLATREDLLTGALQRMAGLSGSSAAREAWYERAVGLAGDRGDLRLVMNLETLARSPHFRSYWIQQNISEIREFAAGVSDLHRSPEEYHEERVLIPRNPGEPGAPAGETTALAEVLRLAPEDAGLYRAWASPSTEQALELLERKVLAPRTGSGPASKEAPAVTLGEGVSGSESDLETRIDEAPPATAGGAFSPQALRRMLDSVQLRALLSVQSSVVEKDSGFVGNRSVIVLLGESEWKAEAARDALRETVEGLWTTSHLGAAWVERRDGGESYHALDGLTRLAVAASGRLLLVSDSPEMLVSVLRRASTASAPTDAVYAAGFRHGRENENFARMMRWMDYPAIHAESGDAESRPPRFFSENIASLSQALARVESATVVRRRSAAAVRESVRYRLRP
ncbi:MAG TPA: hypothetical protein VNK82_00670 [Terriglobales bacterium]|nr:hypothetical protein [Terriglobales bacterium]